MNACSLLVVAEGRYNDGIEAFMSTKGMTHACPVMPCGTTFVISDILAAGWMKLSSMPHFGSQVTGPPALLYAK